MREAIGVYKTAVFFILARMEITAVLYFLRNGVKLHFYSLGTIFEENMQVSRGGGSPVETSKCKAFPLA